MRQTGGTVSYRRRCFEMSVSKQHASQEYQGLFKVADRQIVAMGILQCHGIARGNLDQANTFLNEHWHDIRPKLQEDLNGQVREAIMPQHFNRWGRHYLPSLALAHWTQRCNNFLDKGIQEYGGHTFHTMRDKLDTAFNELPAPRPTHRERVVQRFRSSGRIVTQHRKVCAHTIRHRLHVLNWCRVQLITNGTLKACRDIVRATLYLHQKALHRLGVFCAQTVSKLVCPLANYMLRHGTL